MALSLDGTPVRALAAGGGQTAVTCSSVTMSVNDVMVIMLTSSNQVSSVSGSINGSYAKLGEINGSAGEWSSIWWKLSSSTGTENITANQVSGSYIEGTGFGVSGANTVTPWDTLTGSSFVTNATFHTTGPAITTTGSVQEMVLGVGADGAGGGPYAADAGWIALTLTKTNGLAEYRIEPSVGTFTFNSSNRFFSGGIGAALLQASASTVQLQSQICM